MPRPSPRRHSPPSPPLISRQLSAKGRVRSPERHLEMASTSRPSRERRDYRATARRSRSPILPKRRSYSPPPLKRKASPIAEREIARRTKISKSPIGSRGESEHRYSVPKVEPDSRTRRNVSSSERFRDRDYDEDREAERGGVPQFRGPEGSIDFDISELKKFTIEIVRNPSSNHADSGINRNIINPDTITPVRRPDSYEEDYRYFGRRGKDEGSRPLFLRAEVAAGSSKDRAGNVDYRRIVAIDQSRGSGQREREHSRDRHPPRFSPPHDEQRRHYYHARENSPYETRRRSPNREDYVETKEKHRDRREERREDLRHDLDIRRREDRRYSTDKRPSFERESDLRSRLNEKRIDPHPQEREQRHYDSERGERHNRSHHHSSPPPDRRRHGSPDRREESRDRREGWDREREKERRRPHSRERTERDNSDHHYEDGRRPKHEYEPKKFVKNYEERDFVPPPMRGRGGLPVRRGLPPMMRGRGIVRGMNRGFRGGMMGGIPRGMPRAPFIPRGFPPRFFPPY